MSPEEFTMMPDDDDFEAMMIPEDEAAFVKELRQCAGKWIAYSNNKIIACANTIKDVRDSALKENVDDPIIFQVPSNTGRSFF